MKLLVSTLLCYGACTSVAWFGSYKPYADAFSTTTCSFHRNGRVFGLSSRLLAESSEVTEQFTPATDETKQKQLGLLTFDLDDPLYPIAPVVEEANGRSCRTSN